MTARQVLRYDRTIGIVAMEGRGFNNPVDIAISTDERLYVLSRSNAVHTYGIRIGICDLDSNYFGDFGSYGSDPGQFVWPTAVAFDSDGNLYLADEHNHRITVFDASGGYLRHWGEHGSEDGQIDGPAGIAMDSSGTVLVTDAYNSRVQRFTKDGDFVSAFGSSGTGPGEFNMPWGIALDSHGNIYVADWRNDRIQKFSSDGEFIAAFGESGDGDGQLQRPASVAVDGEGLIYIADWGNERVQVLDPDGGFLEKLRGQSALSKWAMDFYEANSEEWEARLKSNIMVTPCSRRRDPIRGVREGRAVLLGTDLGQARPARTTLRHREQQAPHTDLREAVRQREEHNHERGRTTYPSVRRQTVLRLRLGQRAEGLHEP